MSSPNIKTVWVKYGRVFPLPHMGPNGQADLCCTLQADISQDESLTETIDGLWNLARLSVKKEFDRLPKESNTKKEMK